MSRVNPRKLKIKTIAFPSIATGAYRFPLKRAAEITMKESRIFLEENQILEKVVFVCFRQEILDTYQKTFKDIFGLI